MAKNIRVHIEGTGIVEDFEAKSHELLGLPAGTYHKFILLDGTEALYNDFGIRFITIK